MNKAEPELKRSWAKGQSEKRAAKQRARKLKPESKAGEHKIRQASKLKSGRKAGKGAVNEQS